MMNGSGMMGSPDISTMMLWMPIGLLVGVIVLVGVIWLIMHFIRQRDVQLLPPLSQAQESSHSYEEGYRAHQPFYETSHERAWRDQGPQPKQEYDQPQLELAYPQEQAMPPQR